MYMKELQACSYLVPLNSDTLLKCGPLLFHCHLYLIF